MKTLLLFFGILVSILAAGLMIGEKQIVEPYVKNLILNQGSEALGTKISLDGINVSLFPPAKLSLKGLRFNLKTPNDILVSVPRIICELDFKELLKAKVTLSVLIVDPRVSIVLDKVDEKGEVKAKSSGFNPELLAPLVKIEEKIKLALNFKIENATVSSTMGGKNLNARKLSLNIQSSAFEGPFDLNLSTLMDIDWAPIALALPLSSQGQARLDQKSMSFVIQDLKSDLGGLGSEISGYYQIPTAVQSWKINFGIAEIKNLKIPPAFLPFGQWSGSIKGQIQAQQTASTPLTAQGEVQVNNLQGDIRFQKDQISAEGRFSLNSQTNFKYGPALSISKLLVEGDATQLSVGFSNLFKKPSAVPLKFSMDAFESAGKLFIKKCLFQFHTLTGNSGGEVSYLPGQISLLKVQIPKANLAGFEKFFPIASSVPITGMLELNSSIQGDFQKPLDLNVNINPLLLQNFKSFVKYESPDKKTGIQGSVSLNTKVVLVAQGKNLKSAMADGDMDLTNLNIEVAELFQKKANYPLKLKYQAKQKGLTEIEIKNSELNTPVGKASLKGKVSEIQNPKLNLQTSVTGLNLGELSKLIPMLKVYGLSGLVDSSMAIGGRYDFSKGVQKSPLSVSGSVNVNIPNFKFVTPKVVESKTEQSGPVTIKPDPFLPDWPVFKNLNLTTKLNLNTFSYDDISVSGISWNGLIKDGSLSGNSKVSQVFGGSAEMNQLKVPLLTPAPTVSFSASTKNVNIGSAVNWKFPKYKDVIKGNATGQISVVAAHPSNPNFIQDSKAQGAFNISGGYLSTLPFDKTVNEQLSKIPKYGSSIAKVNTGGANWIMVSKFNFQKGILNFENLDVDTPEKNQLNVQGQLKLDQTVDLKGKVYLADPPISGIFREANSDSQGRLTIPVHITGSVFKPSFGELASEIVSKMVENTVRYELNKQTKQLQQKAQSEVQKATKEVGKDIQQKAQEEMKKLKLPGF